MNTAILAGRRIMIVEDELLVAMMVEDALLELGSLVVGPFARLSEAQAAVQAQPVDGAILDVNVGGDSVYPLAEWLSAHGVPFLLVSGYGQDAIPADRPDWVACAKPFLPEQLTTMLAAQLARR